MNQIEAPPSDDLKSAEKEKPKELTPVEKWFDQKLNTFVYKFRIPIAILSGLWFLIALG